MKTFTDRLNFAYKEAGITKTAIWKYCGVSSGAVTQWFDGTTQELKGDNLLKVSQILNVNPEWLSSGKGRIRGSAKHIAIENKNDEVHVNLLNSVGSMGNGDEIQDSEVVLDVLKLKKNWVDKNIHPTNIKNLAFIHAIGNSMSPTLNDGDILLVDSGVKEITGDCIYVLEAHKRLFIKSVRQTISGQYEIYSDNPAVKTVDLLNGDHEVNVLGRVVWVWNGKKV